MNIFNDSITFNSLRIFCRSAVDNTDVKFTCAIHFLMTYTLFFHNKDV